MTCWPGPQAGARRLDRSVEPHRGEVEQARTVPGRARCSPFNIDAKINGAYIALGLLYGGGDIGKTMSISTRCGQDSDCNPSSAAGILGVVLGYKKIPDAWKSGIPAIADKKFQYTDYSFRTIVESTEKRALAMVQKQGGRLQGSALFVKTADREARRTRAVGRLRLTGGAHQREDPRWQWKGNWRTDAQGGRSAGNTRTSGEKGAEAALEFGGTGAVIGALTCLPAARPTSIWTASSTGPLTSTLTRTAPRATKPCGMFSG